MKKCIDCKQEKPLEEFHNRKDSKDGKQSQCKLCNNARVKKWQADNPDRHKANWNRHTANKDSGIVKARTYNINVEDLQVMYDAANGKCEICKREPIKWLVVDHCHDTLVIRGILCERCNQGLGLFADNIEYMKNAIEYLEQGPKEYRPFEKLPRRSYLASVD